MNSTDSNEQPKKSMSFNQKLLIGGAIVAVIATILGLFGYTSWWGPRNETDPPPIIVKSGSFIFESELDFTLTAGGGSDPDIITINDNFTIRKVRITAFNLGMATVSNSDITGTVSPIQIKLQQWNGTIWQEIADNPITLAQDGAKIKLTSKEKMDAKENKPEHRRRFRSTDKKTKILRIYEVTVGGTIRRVQEGEELSVGIYKQ